MHSRGQSGDFLSIGYFMFLIFIIGGTIFLMAKVVLGVAYDSRLTDASLLGYKIEKCLSQAELAEGDIIRIEETCSIKFKDGNDNERKFILSISNGDKNLFSYGDIVSCGLYSLNEQNPRCVSKTIMVNLDGKEVELNILSGSNIEGEKQ